MAIQSASALNAYLTAGSSASVGAGIPEALTPGTPSPTSAGAERIGVTDREREQEQAPDDGGNPNIGGPLPPIYGSNARSMAGGMRASTISLLA
jgi:hypothetical protein